MDKQRIAPKKKQESLETYKFDTSTYVKIPTISRKSKEILRSSKKEDSKSQPSAV